MKRLLRLALLLIERAAVGEQLAGVVADAVDGVDALGEGAGGGVLRLGEPPRDADVLPIVEATDTAARADERLVDRRDVPDGRAPDRVAEPLDAGREAAQDEALL